MKDKQFYTTGEASQLLQISRATVSRKFDSGVLGGKRNPITGERLISHESILSFMKKYNLPESPVISRKTADELPLTPEKATIKLVVASPQKKLFNTLFCSLKSVSQFTTVLFENGYDAVIHCSNNIPDILILDENLKHISFNDVIRSLRQLDKSHNINIILILKSFDPVKIDDLNADSFLFWDMLVSQKPDHQHEIIAYTIGRLLDNQDIIHYYEERTITNARLSQYHNTVEWVQEISASLHTRISNACTQLESAASNNNSLDDAVRTIRSANMMLRYILSPLRMIPDIQNSSKTLLQLDDIIDRCISILELTTSSKYHVKKPGRLEAIEGDEELIAGVILHLLMNSNKTTSGDGNIKITLQIIHSGKAQKPLLANTEYIHITIADINKGIPDTFGIQIYEPIISSKSGGTEKKISTVQNAVELNNGHIDVVSVPGKGTSVNLYFPVSSSNDGVEM